MPPQKHPLRPLELCEPTVLSLAGDQALGTRRALPHVLSPALQSSLLCTPLLLLGQSSLCQEPSSSRLTYVSPSLLFFSPTLPTMRSLHLYTPVNRP